MKKLGIILGLLVATNASAGIPDGDAYQLSNQFSPAVAYNVQLGHVIQKETVQVAQGVYDFAKQGGGYSYDIGLGDAIPKGSIVKNAYFKVLSPVSVEGTASTTRISVGTSTVALNDIVNPIAVTSLPSVGLAKQGALFGDLGGASTFRMSSASSTVPLKMRVTGSKLTGGKILFVVEYIKADQ